MSIKRSSNSKTLLEIPNAEVREVSKLEFWGIPQQHHGIAYRRGQERVLDRGCFTLSTVDKTDHGHHIEKHSQHAESTITASVGSEVWIIHPDSPVLKLGSNTVVFPHEKNTCFVVVFASSTEPEALGILDALLDSLSIYKEAEACQETLAKECEQAAVSAVDRAISEAENQQQHEVHDEESYKSKRARAVEKMASRTCSGIMVSSIWLADQLSRASHKVTSSSDGADNPVQFSEGFKRRVHHTARAAKAVSKSKNSIIDKMNTGLSKLFSSRGKPATSVGDAPLSKNQELTHASASSILQIYDALEQAGYLVLTSARDNASSIASHKYGADAGEVVGDGLNAGVYALDSGLSFSGRVVARSAAKKTAQNVLRGIASGD